jgi:hypothetical protein
VTLEGALGSGGPFYVEAAHPNERLRAQEGFFIASAVPPDRATSDPFQSLSIAFHKGHPSDLRQSLLGERSRGGPRKLPFVAIVIAPKLKNKLLMYLERTYNRSARVLFPDYSGFREFAAHGGGRGEAGDVPAGS